MGSKKAPGACFVSGGCYSKYLVTGWIQVSNKLIELLKQGVIIHEKCYKNFILSS